MRVSSYLGGDRSKNQKSEYSLHVSPTVLQSPECRSPLPPLTRGVAQAGGSSFPRFAKNLAIGLLFACLTGCTSSNLPEDPSNNGKPTVVSTNTILTDLTAELAGDEINLTGILEPGADPHMYEPVPADSKALENGELILYNGYNLEPGLIKMMNSTGVNAQKLAVGEVVKPLDMDYDGQKVPDPHVWGDPENAIQMVNAIRDSLIELSPEDRDLFTENASQLTATLQQLDTWIAQQMATIPPDKRKLVTTHDAFQYYAAAYGLEVTGTLIGISTEEKPSAQTITFLVETIKKTGVPAIFAETTINPTLIKTVAEEAGVNLAPHELYSDSIGAPGSEGDSYINMMVSNTRTIVEALGGTYQPFEAQSKN